jgi:hypothetical protein
VAAYDAAWPAACCTAVFTAISLLAMNMTTCMLAAHLTVLHCLPQVLFSPTGTPGAGIDNGETTELVNAYMSRTGNSMKNMSGPGRHMLRWMAGGC